jgi:hypothetical protein
LTQQYPSGLPGPLVSSYTVETDVDVTSVVFENGNTRQRSSASAQKTSFGLIFLFEMVDLWQWQAWANAYGYDWHQMNLASPYSGQNDTTLVPHLIRYTGDFVIALVDQGHVQVSIRAELDVSSPPAGAIVPSGDWIIGGTPDVPSSSNSTQAGIPANPSTNFIIAGTPGIPAA